ncbi:complement C1q tumor necrosis factor-related protein 7-like [Ruditapes philippinarum]|uniref:complement C1q tumor necrosis factor-related protein 7-like n=1 Tax=Ruditapes philippinarum TaxID=129788 RepID=UPI00295C235C|nr:complement C1q tumor necrosis factor-related protein 7-like [Ruditapes philippinarum]
MTGQTTLVCLSVLLIISHVVSSFQTKGEQCERCCRGDPGPSGIHGQHGLPGATGTEGRKGDRGEKGYKGDKGERGPIGETGLKGSRGKKGHKGQCGNTGNDGDKGQQGPMGPFGPKGDKGNKGEKCVPSPRIAFFVTRKSKFGPVHQDTTIEFDKVFLNHGEAFDELTSHFVCKINGTYLFNAHVLSQDETDAFVMIMLNDEPRVPMHGDHRSGYGVASNTIILHLTTGDHVWLRLKEGSAISNDSSTFSGYLLYAD